jgi:hypothetical protein
VFEVLPWVVWLSIYLAMFAAEVLYTLTLHTAMRRCAPQNRTLPPGLLWLQMVPVWGVFWWFVNAGAMGESLEKEIRSRGIAAHRPHQALGTTAGWFRVGALGLLVVDYGLFAVVATSEAGGASHSGDWRLAIAILVIAGLAALAFVVAWFMYWARIFWTSRRMVKLGPVRSEGFQFAVAARPQPPTPAASQARVPGAAASWPRTAAMAAPPSLTRSRPRTGPVLDFCAVCGLMAAVDRACPRCGAGRTGSGPAGPADGAS